MQWVIVARHETNVAVVRSIRLKGGKVEETLVQEASFAPGAATPLHIHPDGHEEVAYLLEGAP
jgi:quercetin dioxygenase-like cupin family protein